MMMRSVMAMVVAGVIGARGVAGASTCGNGVVEPPETCDDGNVVGGDGCSATCLVENRAPDCTQADASVGELWPPNHKLVGVSVVGVTDPDGDAVAITVTGIAQDEALDAAGSGASCPDAGGVGTAGAWLRAERSGGGDGRVYHVAFQADDGRGGACTGAVTVCVRHDQRPGGICGDQGPRFDSTAGAGAEPCIGDCTLGCVPPPDDVAPMACGTARIPAGIGHHVARARELLAHASGRHGSRLARRAARHLHRAATIAARHDGLADDCAAALRARLEGASTCAACHAAEDGD